jgi:hypothetical protein
MLDDEVIYLQMSIDAPAAFENVTDTLEGDNNPNGDLSASQEQASFNCSIFIHHIITAAKLTCIYQYELLNQQNVCYN